MLNSRCGYANHRGILLKVGVGVVVASQQRFCVLAAMAASGAESAHCPGRGAPQSPDGLSRTQSKPASIGLLQDRHDMDLDTISVL